MKILCVSDQIDPMIYTSTVKQSFPDTLIILSAGDLPMEYLEFITATMDKPLFYVSGNHHAGDRLNYRAGSGAEHFRAAYIDAKVRYEAGLIVAGLGGSMRYNKKENQFTEFEMSVRILKLLPSLFFNRIFRGRFLDILLTCASPLGIHDREEKYFMGFKCFLRFMRFFKPRYLVHGHIHLYDPSEQRETKYHKTIVINAFGHCLIDTGKIH